MKVFVNGEVEANVSEKFRIAMNIIEKELNCLSDISGINEICFYHFLLKDCCVTPKNRYLKKYNRLEIEIVLSLDEFEAASESQSIEIMKEGIYNSIKNYKNSNIPQMYIDMMVERIKALILVTYSIPTEN